MATRTKQTSDETGAGGLALKRSNVTKREIVKQLYILAEALDVQVTAERIDIYLQALEDIPYEALVKCLRAGIKTWKWFPKVAEIREAVLSGCEEAEAERAWQDILAYADRWHPDIGPMTGCPKLTAREIASVRSLGGIYLIAEELHGGARLPHLRRDFLAVFRLLREDHDQRTLPPTQAIGEIGEGDSNGPKSEVVG